MAHAPTSDDPSTPATPLEAALEEIGETWTDQDPKILALPGDGLPAVAVVRGSIRFLSYNFVYPQPCSLDRIREIILNRGNYHVIQLSEHPAGYRKEQFRLP